MKKEKYFIIVSIIAFASLGYIVLNNSGLISSKYINNQYGAVLMASSTQNSTSINADFSLPPESPVNYADNNNGTITDNYTGLIWKKCPQGISGSDCKAGSPSLRAWSKARVECENLNFAGKSGWRMPTLKELQSIVDSGSFDPAINKKFFIATDDPYWTLTSPAEYPASKFTVLFTDGSVYYRDSNNFAATRCVHQILHIFDVHNLNLKFLLLQNHGTYTFVILLIYQH